MEVRVRLVFADDVGRHVQRRRGFSACWYLVPKEVKLVGDLAHALLREFGLRKRCPRGLELRLDELPLLATQSVRIVRDNDTIVVQCPPLEDEDECNGSSASESEVDAPKQHKRKDRGKKQTVEQPKKKTKRNEDVLKQVAVRVETKANKNAVKERGERKKSAEVESSSSDSSSSSSDSGSSSSESSSDSSSSSDSEADSQQKLNRVAQAAPAKQQEKPKGAAVANAPNGDASKTNEKELNGKEPRRRRRRLRQRNGNRQRNGSQANPAENSASSAPPSGNIGTASQSIVPEEPNLACSARQNGSNVADLRDRRPRGKGHVLFDQETGDQLAKKHADTDTGENGLATRGSQHPELAKYGPSSSGNQRSRSYRDDHDRSPVPFHDKSSNGDKSDYVEAPTRKGKGKYEERWKRPYEIVATVFDKNAESSSKTNSSTPDLTKLLASYPKAAALPCRFEQKDVIAFKTLTLCLETWQPLLSDWQCGQVQIADASGNSIELSDWTLAAKGETVDFRRAPNSEPRSVQTGEISELRFLSGPSYSSLRQRA